MSIQIWTRDQAPEFAYLGGQSIARGVENGVTKLIQGFQRQQEENKRISQAAKASDAFLKSLNEDERSALGLPDPDTFSLQGAHDKIATFTGAMQAMGAKRTIAQLRDEAAQTQARQAKAANDARFPAFAGEMGSYAPPGDLPYNVSPDEFNQFALPEGQTQPGPREFFQSVNRTGYNPGAESDNLLRALEAGSATKSGGYLPEPFEVGGMKGIVSPKTGSIHVKDNPNALPFDKRLQLLDRKALFDEKRSIINAMGHAVTDDEKAHWRGQLDSINQRISDTTEGAPSDVDRANAYADQLRQERMKLEAEMRSRGETMPADSPAPTAPGPPPITATNPKTGQKLIFKDGKWQPLNP